MKQYRVMVNQGTGSVRVKYLDTEFGCWFWLQDEWGYPMNFGNALLAQRWVAEHSRLERVDEADEAWKEIEG